jgi:hypothetical protein
MVAPSSHEEVRARSIWMEEKIASSRTLTHPSLGLRGSIARTRSIVHAQPCYDIACHTIDLTVRTQFHYGKRQKKTR